MVLRSISSLIHCFLKLYWSSTQITAINVIKEPKYWKHN